MSNKNKWLIGAGIVLGLLILFVLPSIWQALFPAQAFGMMGIRHSPMMGFGRSYFGMGFGMFLVWLIPPGLLVLIGLGIAALVKYLRTPSA